VIFSGIALATQPPSQAQYSATYVVLGDFIKQTATGNIPYAASVPTTTANSVTVNSGGFTFDFGPHLPVGDTTLPGNSSGLTVTADTGFMVGTTAFGGSGTATLTVTGPGQLSTTDAQIGIGVGVTGTLTLSGSQTKWVDTAGTNSGLIIGNSFIGDPSGGTGTVNVIGGATLNANGGMTVGNIGSGTLNVTGATASALKVLIGGVVGSTGTLNIGTNSTVTSTGLLAVGFSGNGSLSVAGSGASLSVGGDARIGNMAGSIGSVIVKQGGGLSVTGEVDVGAAGGGTFTMNGPATTTVGGDMLFAVSTGARGSATISQGGTVNVTGGLGVGMAGPGTLTVAGAGTSVTTSKTAVVGNSATGTCSVTVQQGGALRVQTGAATSQSTFNLGTVSGSSGQLTVTDSGSSLVTTGLGQGPGSATVNVQNGGSIASNVFEIGGTAGGTGQASISGTNSNVVVTLGAATQANGFFAIGLFGQGTLTINGAGSASAPFVLIGAHPGAVGQTTVSDSQSILQTTQILSVGTGYVPSQGLNLGPIGGAGTLRLTAGGSATVGQQLAMGNGGMVTLDSGGDMLIGSDSLPTTPATLQIANGGTISGTGTISANVLFSSSTSSTYSGAIVDAAGASHSLTLNGSAGTLSLAGTSTFTGGITIGAGTLNINSDAALGGVPSTPASNIMFSGSASGGTLQFASTFAGGLLSLNRSITVNPTSAGTIDTNGNNVAWGGALFNSGTFTKVSAGTLNIGGLVLGNNSALAVQGGTLRLNVGSASTVGSGVTATISVGATLELAGPTSALSAGTNRVDVVNSSNSTGLLVTGSNQQVGGIDGPGTAQINAGSDLTANHIVQSALVINGTAVSPGLAIIDSSDPSGNPLDQPAFAGSGSALSNSPSNVLAAGSAIVAADLTGGVPNQNLAPSHSTAQITYLGTSSAVPEPASAALLAIGVGGSTFLAIARRRRMRLHA
jgi:T5SS/PEP-CTERM-associated repeat protein